MFDYAEMNGLKPQKDLPGIPDAGRKVLEEMRMAKGFYQSNGYSYHPLQFNLSAKFIPKMQAIFEGVAKRYDYSS